MKCCPVLLFQWTCGALSARAAFQAVELLVVVLTPLAPTASTSFLADKPPPPHGTALTARLAVWCRISMASILQRDSSFESQLKRIPKKGLGMGTAAQECWPLGPFSFVNETIVMWPPATSMASNPTAAAAFGLTNNHKKVRERSGQWKRRGHCTTKIRTQASHR